MFPQKRQHICGLDGILIVAPKQRNVLNAPFMFGLSLHSFLIRHAFSGTAGKPVPPTVPTSKNGDRNTGMT